MKLTTLFLATMATVIALSTGAQELSDADSERVIARVGNEEITAGQFLRDTQFRIIQLRAATGKDIKPDLRFRRLLMEEMIQERILSIATRNAGVSIAEEELEAEFNSRKEVFDSEEGFEEYLKRTNLTEAELKEHMRTRLRIKQFVDQEAGEISISAEEIDARYDLMKSKGSMTRLKNTRDIAVILLRAKGGTDESWRDAEDRAMAVKARIDGGESFEEVAKETSEDPNTRETGGKLFEMEVGSFFPELETALDSLEVGGVSDPVRSTMGWYVMTLIGVNEPGTVSKEKVADRIEAQLVAEKRKEVIDGIVAETRKLIRVEIMADPDAPLVEPADDTAVDTE